jgi:hypothetical protein
MKDVNMTICKSWLALPLMAAMALWLTGCQTDPPSSSNGSGTTTDDHGHEHGEEGHEHGDHAGHDHSDHAHVHTGPHGGHIGVIGDEKYHYEWTHDAGKVTIYILDAEGKKEVPIEAETLTIEVKIQDKVFTYELLAVNSQGEPAKSAQFELEDSELEGTIETLGPKNVNVSATIKDLTIEGESFGDVKIEEHDHDHAH